MPVHDFRCPHCNGIFRLSDMQLGKKLRCGKCNEIFTAPTAGELGVKPIATPIVAKPLTTPSDEAAPYLTIEDEPPAIAEKPKEDDLPVRRRRNAATDETPKRKVRNDEDDDDRDTRPKPKVGMVAIVLAGIGLAFIVGVSVIGYVIYVGFQQAPNASPVPVAVAPFNPAGNAVPANPRVVPRNPLDPPKPFGKPFIPLPVTVPALAVAPLTDGEGVVKFKNPVGGVAIGGGGRFLVFVEPLELQLSIFDAQEAKIVADFPLEDADALVAANATCAIVVYPKKNRIERYNLLTRHKEHDGPFETNGFVRVRAIAMGSASAGPLLVLTATKEAKDLIKFYDPNSIERYGIQNSSAREYWGQMEDDQIEGMGHASPNGKLFSFTITKVRGSARPVTSGMIVTFNAPEAKYAFPAQGLYPAGDASGYYGKGGFYGLDGKGLSGIPNEPGQEQWIPAVHGSLGIRTSSRSSTKRDAISQLTVHTAGQMVPLTTLPRLPITSSLYSVDTMTIDLANHLFLIPDAKLLAALDAKRTTLYLRRFDPDAVPPVK